MSDIRNVRVGSNCTIYFGRQSTPYVVGVDILLIRGSPDLLKSVVISNIGSLNVIRVWFDILVLLSTRSARLEKSGIS